MLISIESSCDDSSIAITDIKTKKLLLHKKISQEGEHQKYGGVVPELASRLHLEYLPKILEEAKPYLKDCKAVAVTNEPGLNVTLVLGVTMAKAIALSLKIPLIAVNHLQGHIYSLFIEKENIEPHTTLLLSGGHTQLMEFNGYSDIKVISKTLDDSLGEAFDKTAKMLGYPYPGGIEIERLANSGVDRFNFPVPLSNSPLLDFSYSGLKNAVRLQIQRSTNLKADECDIAKSFMVSATKHLTMKCKKYFKTNTPKLVSIVGGVSANRYIREEMSKLASSFGAEIIYPDMSYCSDNAAMIGRCAVDAYNNRDFTSIDKLGVNSKFINF